jgi:hypothetical protein
MAKKATSAEVASKKKQKAVVVNLVPGRTMIKKAVVVSLVLETIAMKVKTTEVANPMMTKNPMAESRAAWAGVFKTQARATTLRPWTMAPWRTF